jgi:hypothetical protein
MTSIMRGCKIRGKGRPLPDFLIRHVDSTVRERCGFKVPGKRHKELVAHGQPLVIRPEIPQFSVLRRF